MTVALNDFLGALVVEMDREKGDPIEGVNLVEAIKMSDNPLQWKALTFVFGIMAFSSVIANIIAMFE
jgi:hypothetical protein